MEEPRQLGSFNQMQILIISGFLGAGKTRFIQEMVAKTKRFFAIIENEFGDVNVDQHTLSQTVAKDLEPSSADLPTNWDKARESLRIWELTEGCICCATNQDFTTSVLTIANTINPDFLIVEPTGIAQLSKIIQKLKPICYEQIELLAPITILDAQHYAKTQKKHGQSFFDQVRHAGTIVLSKSETMTEAEFKRIAGSLKLIEDVVFPTMHYEQWPNQIWDDLLSTKINWSAWSDGRQALKSGRFIRKKMIEQHDLKSFTIHLEEHLSVEHLIAIMECVIRRAFGQIVRCKGYVNGRNRDGTLFGLHVELVEGIYEIMGVDPVEKPSLVFIGQEMNQSLLESAF